MNGRLGDDESLGGIRVFDRDGTFLFRSSNTNRPFLFEYHSGVLGGSEEPEGLTNWDVDAVPATIRPPDIDGQLHASLLDNDPLHDDFYLKHYRVPA